MPNDLKREHIRQIIDSTEHYSDATEQDEFLRAEIRNMLKMLNNHLRGLSGRELESLKKYLKEIVH